MLELLTGGNTNAKAILELAHAMQTVILTGGLVACGLLVWIGVLSEKLGKFKVRLRQLEDWKLQFEARLSPKP